MYIVYTFIPYILMAYSHTCTVPDNLQSNERLPCILTSTHSLLVPFSMSAFKHATMHAEALHQKLGRCTTHTCCDATVPCCILHLYSHALKLCCIVHLHNAAFTATHSLVCLMLHTG